LFFLARRFVPQREQAQLQVLQIAIFGQTMVKLRVLLDTFALDPHQLLEAWVSLNRVFARRQKAGMVLCLWNVDNAYCNGPNSDQTDEQNAKPQLPTFAA
jgi:hypothetical protein